MNDIHRSTIYVFKLSFISRAAILLLQFVANHLLPDHHADAYRNKYHEFLDQHSNNLTDTRYNVLFAFINGLTKWDGQYFLEISLDGYVSEKHLAFSPAFPLIISTVYERLVTHKPRITSSEGFNNVSLLASQHYIGHALIAIFLNNFILFPLAALFLFLLTKIVKKKEDIYARRVVWWFCFNPASIFFSACYTETLFSALTFIFFLIIEWASFSVTSDHGSKEQPMKRQAGYEKKIQDYVPMSQLNRILKICLFSLPFIALGTATRSNALVNILMIWYQFFLKYLPIYKERSLWSLTVTIGIFFEAFQDLLVILMSTIISASGFITFQIYSYIEFCREVPKLKKGMTIRPEWCDHFLPQPYSNVQAKYWDVGLLKYYQFKQLPNFLLALPILYIVFAGAHEYALNLRLKTIKSNKALHVYYIQTVLLSIFCGLAINVQVTTRLLASCCPLVYWLFEDFSQRSPTRRRILVTYCLMYFLIGASLHSNFYPWT